MTQTRINVSRKIRDQQPLTLEVCRVTSFLTHTHTHTDSLLSIRGSRAVNVCLHNRFLRMYALRIAELQNHWALSFAAEIQPKENGKLLVWGVSFLSSLISFYLSSPLLLQLNSQGHVTPRFLFKKIKMWEFGNECSLKKKLSVSSPPLSAGVCQR